MEIFKYSAHGAKVLRNCELKISDPRQFNDPFEFCPRFDMEVTESDIERKLQDVGFLENIYRRNSALREDYPTYASFLRDTKENKSRWIGYFLKKFSRALSPDTLAETAAARLGVICFAQICDDILMWSHYADHHRGMVIQFAETAFGSSLDVVRYENERPSYNPVFDVHDCAQLTRSMTWKSEHWAYEREVRLLVPWDLSRQRTLENGNTIRTLRFPPASVQRVLLGCMAPEALVVETKEIMSDKRYHHAKLQRMTRDLTRYKLHALDV